MTKKTEPCFLINGGKSLNGELKVYAAKNAITKQIIASMLSCEPSVFLNAPKSNEVFTLLNMLGEVGMKHEWEDNKLRVITSSISNSDVSSVYSGVNRLPILFVGPLVHRTGTASVPMVGGCDIGSRPIDFHINSLRRLGITVVMDEKTLSFESRSIEGNRILLPYPSVGATENIIFSAITAHGRTVLMNAAIEPEILDTIKFLRKMGAKIKVSLKKRTIYIDGIKKLKGVTHTSIADRIEAASYGMLAVATNGKIDIYGADYKYLQPFLSYIEKIGGGIEIQKDRITFFRKLKKLRGIDIETDVYPGFATDWQPLLGVLLTQAQGISRIHETVYENRLGYTDTLRSIGADITLTDECLGDKGCRFHKRFIHSCVISGPTLLKGTEMKIPDLRAGFAYVAAALMAKGESRLSHIHYVERGYPNLVENLSLLGANISLIK
ncbi:UDP-N-acetylglucosamine 1-carboxyvinyltransferase [Candidatus Azambacteria bacterium]|nr:UDP-N-acetylglucosamine 1-carboxyvinyltransferase [Candidatus Azambacteria bacterium]